MNEHIQVNPGTSEWLDIRRGIITASKAKEILKTPKKKGAIIAESTKTYLMTLVSEMLTGQTVESFGKPLQWGTDNEPLAIKDYEAETFAQVKPSGFWKSNIYPMFGGTPDGLIDGGIIEVKCPFNTNNHLDTIIHGMPSEHMPQVQSNIYLTGVSFCDFISYDPRIKGKNKLYIQRIERDNDFIDKILEKVKISTEYIYNTLKELDKNEK